MEYVLLLCLLEGQDHLRAHDGVVYLYRHDGAFVAYKVTRIEYTFGRVKKYLLQREGLFRLLPRDVKRDDVVVLAGIASSVNLCSSM